MRSLAALACCGVLTCWAAGAAAKPAYVLSTVNLRAAPGTTNEIVAKIPGGSLVDAGDCTGGWCAVTWQDKRGFTIQTSLDLSGRVPQRRAAMPRGPAVVEEGGPVYYEEPPAYYYYRGPYYRPYGYYGYYRPYYGYRRWRYW